MQELVKIVVFVPTTHASIIRQVIGEAGAGKIGNYSYCSFSSTGTGRFKPEKGSNPAIGEIGKLEEVEEERIEVTCNKDLFQRIVKIIKDNHPYEVPVIEVYPLITIE